MRQDIDSLPHADLLHMLAPFSGGALNSSQSTNRGVIMAKNLKSVRVRTSAPKTAHGLQNLKKVRVVGSAKK